MRTLFFSITSFLFCSSIVLAQKDTISVKSNSLPMFLRKEIQSSESLWMNREIIDQKTLGKERNFINHSLYPDKKPLSYPSYKISIKWKQRDDSYHRLLLPASLIAFGAVNRNKVKNKGIQTIQTASYPHKRVTKIDDYLRYMPYVGIYGFDLIGIKAKHNFIDRTFVLLTSYIIMDQFVDHLKDNTPTWRPNGSDQRSFPSSHTSTAFLGAHITFREYKDSSPWIASSGYVFASATAILRMVNKAHSFADVMAGAGMGILSAEIGYALLPLFQKIVGIKDKKLIILPTINNKGFGASLAYNF